MNIRKITCALLLVSILVVSGMNAHGQQDKVEITLWHHWTGHRTEWVQSVLDRFMAEHPWIEAKQIVTPSGGTDQLTNFLITGTAPEIVMVNSDHALQFITMGGFLRLDELMTQDGIDINMFNGEDLRGFQLHGATYALPIMSGSAWTNLMFYNRDMLEEVGLSGDVPPATWNDWSVAARRMTKTSDAGRIERAGTTIPPLHYAALWNDNKLWSDDWRQVTVDTARLTETSEFLIKLSEDVFVSYSGYTTWIGSNVNFYNQDFGLWFSNNSAFGFLKDMDFNWGVTLAPVNDLQPNAKPVGLILNTWAYAIPAEISGDKLEATWQLLKWLSTEEEGAGWFSRIQGRPSPVLAFNSHPEYVWENPNWPTVIEAVMHDVAAPPINVNGIVAPIRDQILNKNIHPQQGFEQIERALQAGLTRYWESIE